MALMEGSPGDAKKCIVQEDLISSLHKRINNKDELDQCASVQAIGILAQDGKPDCHKLSSTVLSEQMSYKMKF
jgi:hypothetical protein